MLAVDKTITANDPHAAHRSWLWLVLGGALFALATVHYSVPMAAWLAPILLLRVARVRRARTALPLILLALTGGSSAALTGYIDPPPPAWMTYGIAVSYALIFSLPYLADALLAPRLRGIARTLIFPAALTSLDWLLQFHPFPNFGSPAYTQYGNLPLMQLAALTGIWGITFLIGWCASALNAAWEQGWERRAIVGHVGPLALALALALFYGGARLAFAAPASSTVQVAAIVPHRDLWSYPPVAALAQADAAERAAFSARAAANVEELFTRTEQAAAAGAQIAVWAENAAFVPVEDAPHILERAAAMAREHGIYLQIGLSTILRSEQHPFGENRAVLFDPQGAQIWDYHKGYLVPVGDAAEMAPGPRVIPTVDTLFGRLATVICYDDTNIGYLRQAGQARVDLLFVPSDDWFQARYDHLAMTTFRAIENGIAVVRPDVKGVTLLADHLGRTLAQSDQSSAPPAALTMAATPVQGVPTLYMLIGDSLAYACMAALALLAALALTRRTAPGAAPQPA